MKTKKLIRIGLVTFGLLTSSISLGIAAETPSPTATKSTSAYGAQLIAYKAALIQYRVTVALNAISYRIAMEKYQADWQVTLTKYEAEWKAAMAKYQAAQSARALKLEPVNLIQKTALDKADNDFVTANAAAKNPAQQDLALKVRADAMLAANTIYKAAVLALGPAPIKPIKPVELTKPVPPVKPVAPIKPVPPVKPATK
jgi:hypothetical protein